LIYLWGTILASILVAIPLAYYQIPLSLQFELDGPGMVFTFIALLIGFLLRWWSIRTLGQYFTVNVASHKVHRLVTDGPYALIRHPSYTGLLLEFLALALTFQNALSLCIILLPAFIALLQRILIGERLLEDTLGDEYRSYRHQTCVLFPFLY
jgi:protein-S-isoprenylcysteine O-methyltransferase Ste14